MLKKGRTLSYKVWLWIARYKITIGWGKKSEFWTDYFFGAIASLYLTIMRKKSELRANCEIREKLEF